MDNVTGRGPFSPDDISDWFWSVIALADHSRERLESILGSMSQADLIRFHNEFQEAAAQLVDEPLAEHLPADTSEEHLQDIAEWVVSQGKAFFTAVWNNPEKIAEIDLRRGVTYSSVSDNVHWERFNGSVPETHA